MSVAAENDHGHWLRKFQADNKAQNERIVASGVVAPSAPKEDEVCSLCLDPMQLDEDDGDEDDDFPDGHMQLRCGHRFHDVCLFEHDDHGARLSDCPLCRQSCLDSKGRLMAWRRHRHHGPMWFNVGEMMFDEERAYRAMPASEQDEQLLLQLVGEKDSLPTIEAMLQRGVSPDAAYSDGTSALVMAALNGNVDAVESLLSHGARVRDEERYAGRKHAQILALLGRVRDFCGGCNRRQETGLLQCSRCKTTRYCGRDCQRAHWSKHKVHCKWRAEHDSPADMA